MKSLKQILTLALTGLFLAAALTACKDEPAPAAVAPVVKYVERPAPVRKVCNDCGTIVSIEEMRKKGKGSGLGIAAGVVLGAVIGHQVGDGRGNDAATAAGAIGGGFAGNEIEKRAKSTVYYHVTVAMESGGTRSAHVSELNGLSNGGKVRIVGNNLERAGG